MGEVLHLFWLVVSGAVFCVLLFGGSFRPRARLQVHNKFLIFTGTGYPIHCCPPLRILGDVFCVHLEAVLMLCATESRCTCRRRKLFRIQEYSP